MNNKDKNRLKILIAAILIIIAGFSFYIGYKIVLLIKQPEVFRTWIESFGIYAPLIYVLITILQIMIPLIPGEPMEIVAGYAFDSVKGTILCLLAESIGSIIVLLIVRKFGRKIVELFFEKKKIEDLKFLNSDENGVILFAMAFIMPGTPKDLLCYYGGLTDIDIRKLMLITTLGRIPSIITSTLAGSSLGDQQYIKAISFLLIAAALSLLGMRLYKNIHDRNSSKK